MATTKNNTTISSITSSRRVQDLAKTIGSDSIKNARKNAFVDLSEMRPEEILSLFHEGKITQKDTMFWLGVLAVNAEEKAKKHEKLAIVDELTQVHNRRAFIDTLSRELTRLRAKHLQIKRLLAEPMSLTLMMIDIDFFKKVNDKYGHLAGDHVLKGVADILKQQVRGTDTVFRYGGEEFAILLPDTEKNLAIMAAERINKAVKRVKFSISKGGKKKVGVTVSIGINTIEGQDISNIKVTDMIIPKMIAKSDEALYFAKENGRDQVVVWNKKMRNKK